MEEQSACLFDTVKFSFTDFCSRVNSSQVHFLWSSRKIINCTMDHIPPCLRSNFQQLFFNGNLGSNGSCEKVSIIPQKSQGDFCTYDYHYTLRIPYAGKHLVWDIIFNPTDFHLAPDFDFKDEHFMNVDDIDLIINNIPSLVDWDVSKPKSLLNVLKEFYEFYKKQQVDKLRRDNMYSDFCNEFENILQENDNLSSDKIEIFFDSNNTVHMLVAIKIDCSKLPAYFQSSTGIANKKFLNPGEDFIYLRCSVSKADTSNYTVLLSVSPRIDQALSFVEEFEIPSSSKFNNLSEYIEYVSEEFQRKIDEIGMYFDRKKVQILSFAAHPDFSILEYDSATYDYCALLYKKDDYNCLVNVEIGAEFPNEGPIVTVKSVYCSKNNKPCSELLQYDQTDCGNPMIVVKNVKKKLEEHMILVDRHQHQ